MTVIVVSFFESVFADHSKDHAVAVAYLDDTLTGEPYTTLLDSTRDTLVTHEVNKQRETLATTERNNRRSACVSRTSVQVTDSRVPFS